MALRGHATIQGSTDIPTLYNLLPGYLPMPSAVEGHRDLASYLKPVALPKGGWARAPQYMVSLLKAWYGDAATAANEFGYSNLPKLAGDFSFQPMLLAMKDGNMRGLFCMGQNPAVGAQNARLVREGLARLDWLVVRDAYDTETSSFWRSAPEIVDGTVSPSAIGSEVFLLPAAMCPEKEGSFTNTMRLVQFHEKAVEPPADARSELHFVYHLGRRLKELYADSSLDRDRPLQALTWEYPTNGPLAEPDAEAIIAEVNGFTVADRSRCPTVDWPGHARFPADQGAGLPAARGRQGPRRAGRRRAVHHAGRGQGASVRAERPEGRPVADPLRAVRVADGEPGVPSPD